MGAICGPQDVLCSQARLAGFRLGHDEANLKLDPELVRYGNFYLGPGYTHGMAMVVENVRQLRGTVDDTCPGAAEGKHSYDYSPGKCRQVRDAEITMNLGWAMPATGSSLIMRR